MTIFIQHSTTLWLLATCAIIMIELVLLNTYYLLALAVGSSIAAAAAWWGVSSAMQWLSFTFGSIVGLMCMHALRRQPSNKPHDDISHLLGKIVTVTETIQPRGRVTYKSVGWAAESEDILYSGEQARIIRVHGSTLFVEKM